MKSFGLKSLVDPLYETFEKFMPDLNMLSKLPPSVNYFYVYPHVDDQGPFGTCVAFCVKKVFEFFYRKRKGHDILISATGIFSVAKSEYYPTDKTDDGLQVSDGLNIVKQFYVYDKDLPYLTDKFEECLRPVQDNIKHKDFLFQDFVTVNPDVNLMRTAIYKHGPLVIGIDWQNEWMNPGNDGRLQSAGTTSAGGHCVSIIGYLDHFVNMDNSKGAFIVMNNWSDTWAYSGMAFLPYNATSFPTSIFTVKA